MEMSSTISLSNTLQGLNVDFGFRALNAGLAKVGTAEAEMYRRNVEMITYGLETISLAMGITAGVNLLKQFAQSKIMGKIFKKLKGGGQKTAGLTDMQVINSFAGNIRATTLKNDYVAYRLYGGSATKMGGDKGIYLMTQKQIEGTMNVNDLRNKMAIGTWNTFEDVVPVTIPAGTKIYTGKVAGQSFGEYGNYQGGGFQIFIEDKDGLKFGTETFLE